MVMLKEIYRLLLLFERKKATGTNVLFLVEELVWYLRFPWYWPRWLWQSEGHCKTRCIYRASTRFS